RISPCRAWQRPRRPGADPPRGDATSYSAIAVKTPAKLDVRIRSSRSITATKLVRRPHQHGLLGNRLSRVANLADRPGQTPQTMPKRNPPNGHLIAKAIRNDALLSPFATGRTTRKRNFGSRPGPARRGGSSHRRRPSDAHRRCWPCRPLIELHRRIVGDASGRAGMEVFVQQLINGITLGSIYGLIAIGYNLVVGIIGMVNFAHGDVFMVSAFIALITFLVLTTWLGIGSIALALLIMLVVAMLLTSLVNWAIERVAYRPLRGSFRLAPLISAIGMSI